MLRVEWRTSFSVLFFASAARAVPEFGALRMRTRHSSRVVTRPWLVMRRCEPHSGIVWHTRTRASLGHLLFPPRVSLLLPRGLWTSCRTACDSFEAWWLVKKYQMSANDLSKTPHWPNIVAMLVQRLRRWPNIATTLAGCRTFSENPLLRTVPSSTPLKDTRQHSQWRRARVPVHEVTVNSSDCFVHQLSSVRQCTPVHTLVLLLTAHAQIDWW